MTAAVNSFGLLPMMSSNVLCQKLRIFASAGFFASFALDQLARQLEDAVDVVVVDVADHHTSIGSGVVVAASAACVL